MFCSSSDNIRTISMAKPVRKGFLKRYKKRFIGTNWREEWVVLHEDSSLEWYSDHSEDTLRGGITLKEAPEMIAAGPYAGYVPGKPELPKDAEPSWLMVFGTKNKEETHWFLATNEDDLNRWMTAISNTLPPPPKAPAPQPGNPQPTAPPPPGAPPGAPPGPPPGPPPGHPPGAPPPYYPPGGGGGGHHGGGGPGGGYGGRPYGGGYGGGGYGDGRYGGPGGGTNTIIIDRDRGDGMGNFASGMLVGTALGTGMGWGVPMFGMGFGGWGFGVGFGVPALGFGGRAGGSYQDNDTNIVNNYNTTNYYNGDTNDNNPVDNSNTGPSAEPDAEVFNPEQIQEEEPAAAANDGVDDGLTGAISDEGGLEPGLASIDPASDPGGGGGVGYGDAYYGNDNEGMNYESGMPPGNEYNMDYADEGYDMMGGGYDTDIGGYDMDMGGGYDVDLGGMDFGF